MEAATKVNELFQYMEVESTSIRVFCMNTDDVDFGRLNETKPDFVGHATRSNDASKNKICFNVLVIGGLSIGRDLEIRQWLNENV